MRVTTALAALLVLAVPAAAQSITGGALRGAAVDAADGRPLDRVQLTIESSGGRGLLFQETQAMGTFSTVLLAPGMYSVLFELEGYQPVRVVGVRVIAGQVTSIAARLERRPPPITSVDTLYQAGVPAGTTIGRALVGGMIREGDRFRAGTDVSRQLTQVDGPRDAREGFAVSGLGSAGAYGRLFVDGLPEALYRHPALPAEPISAPLFPRDGLDQAQLVTFGFDTEWRGAAGPMLAAATRKGGDRVRFEPYATFSTASLGGAADDNPADSAASSFQVGAAISGPIIPDTASFSLRFDYQQLRTPGAYPWANDQAQLGGSAVSLREALPQIAEDVYGVSVASAIAPVVRNWKGFNALGRVDWQVGRHGVMFRFGFARWTEEQPLLGEERSTMNGSSMEATDLSGALSITSAWSRVSNEFRLGFVGAKRDWLSGEVLPATRLAAEGIALGGAPALPGLFDTRTFDISDALQLSLGNHRFKLGGSLSRLDYEQTYRYGSEGIFTFGGLDAFSRGEGTWFQSVGPAASSANPVVTTYGLFLQDSWTLSQELNLLVGVRWDGNDAPEDLFRRNAEWEELNGSPSSVEPEGNLFSPRASLVWDVRGAGEWVVRLGAGLFAGRVDPALVSEAVLFDGSTTIRRGQGTFLQWPGQPSAAEAPDAGARLAYFNGTSKLPRAFKTGVGVSRSFPSGTALHLTAGYHHTDFFSRRTDANLVAAATGETQEGRPVYGRLVQQGGLVSPAPGSNRRFGDFDLVSVFSSTGYSDYFDFSAVLERRRDAGLSWSLAYTFSRTEDNLLGMRSLDPADQLNPFPEGLDGTDWSDGRSDFDVPHRTAASLDYRTAGRMPLTVGVRGRYRSGLPFTPGFQPGVDLNGDGAGGNDPASVQTGVPGIAEALSQGNCSSGAGAFAERNSCREAAAYGLDVRLGLGLYTMKDGGRLSVFVDAFNLVSSELGLVDRALLLVDPAGALVSDGKGGVTVPLVVNPNFGNLASRRVDPRLVRFGVRMEY
jgi:hypothetical protein